MKANPALQALIDLSNIELVEAQDADPDLRLISDICLMPVLSSRLVSECALKACTPRTSGLSTHI